METEPILEEMPRSEVMDRMDRFARELKKFAYLPESLLRVKHTALKNRFEKLLLREFPGRSQEISVFLSMPDFLWKCASVKDSQESQEREKFDPQLIKDLAEYQFLFTNFLVNNREREYLKKFWEYFGHMSKIIDTQEIFAPLKVGFLGQVAMERLFESSRIAVRSATPREDAYYKIDLWVADPSGLTAIQVKTSPDVPRLEIIGQQDEITVPALTPEEAAGTEDIFFFEHFFRNINVFRMRTKKYAEELGHPIKAYVLLLPGKEVDNITGEPSENLEKQFREKIKRIIRS